MADTAWKNKLYLGDNLDILREYVASGSVDLIYLDPHFNSNTTCNVLFQEKSGEKSAAHINNRHLQKSTLLTRYSQRLEGPRHA
jgi:adenine specific DNA methylase Mod